MTTTTITSDVLTEPNGCRHCGADRHLHAQRWAPGVGFHQWTAPTAEQRLVRMRRRRAVTVAASAVLLLEQAGRQLRGAPASAVDTPGRYLAAHRAALHTAAAVVQALGDPDNRRARRTRPLSVWALLCHLAPTLRDHAAHWAATSKTRAAVEAGVHRLVTAHDANTQWAAAEQLLGQARLLLGLAVICRVGHDLSSSGHCEIPELDGESAYCAPCCPCLHALDRCVDGHPVAGQAGHCRPLFDDVDADCCPCCPCMGLGDEEVPF